MLLDEHALAPILHVDAEDVEASIARDHHDLRPHTAHGHHTPDVAPLGVHGAVCAAFRYLDKGKVACRLPHLRHGAGQIAAHDAGHALAHHLRGSSDHAAKCAA